MPFCHSCGAQMPDGASFCGGCGTKLATPVAAQPRMPPVMATTQPKSAPLMTLKCASCGSNLQISDDMTVFNCQYCGAKQMVNRSGGHVELSIITEAVKNIQVSGEKTASELALSRLKKDYEAALYNLANFDSQAQIKEAGQAGAFFIKILLTIIMFFVGAVFLVTGFMFLFAKGDFQGLLGVGIGIILGYVILRVIKNMKINKEKITERQSQRRLLELQISELLKKIEHHKNIVQ